MLAHFVLLALSKVRKPPPPVKNETEGGEITWSSNKADQHYEEFSTIFFASPFFHPEHFNWS